MGLPWAEVMVVGRPGARRVARAAGTLEVLPNSLEPELEWSGALRVGRAEQRSRRTERAGAAALGLALGCVATLGPAGRVEPSKLSEKV